MTATAARESELRGGRWLYAEPTPEDVRTWFFTQPLHADMSHERYATGVVLIPASEKHWIQQQKDGTGEWIDIRAERRTWTPYMSVSTRINYFRDYVSHLNQGRIDGPYKGEIEPVEQNQITEGPLANIHLPKGYSLYATMQGDNLVPYVVCTMRVSIIERRSGDVLLSAEDSRQIPAGDEFVIMKARTSAVGRALGVAGMLVIGTGVASAEEVQDAIEREGRAPAYASATLPDVSTPQTQQAALSLEEMRLRARNLYTELAENHTEVKQAFDAWYAERKFPGFDSTDATGMTAIVRKLERDLDQAKGGAS